MSIHDLTLNQSEQYDKIANDRDWRDGIDSFRSKISKEITEIYQSIAKIEQEIKKIKGETP